MCSLNVVSLFTNIPLIETIGTCTDPLTNNLFTCPMTKSHLQQLLEVCTKESVFFFEGSLYKQVDGVVMGSPLGALLANVSICHSEQKWLEGCPNAFRPIFNHRYVGDSFVVFRSKEIVQPFLQYLNTQHDNVKFTSDPEEMV